MARVTVEDCLHGVDNRFQLILVASKRARQICDGSESHVPLDGDKPTVLALREISEGFVGREILEESDEELIEAEIAEEMALEMGDTPQSLDADF